MGKENSLRPRTTPYTGPRQPRRDNPNYAYGKTGFRPPRKWWDRMMRMARQGYKKREGQSDKSYHDALSKIIGGIWSKFSDETREKIYKKYEAIPVGHRINPGAPTTTNGALYLPCPICETYNPANSPNIFLRCKGCGRQLKRVKITQRRKM